MAFFRTPDASFCLLHFSFGNLNSSEKFLLDPVQLFKSLSHLFLCASRQNSAFSGPWTPWHTSSQPWSQDVALRAPVSFPPASLFTRLVPLLFFFFLPWLCPPLSLPPLFLFHEHDTETKTKKTQNQNFKLMTLALRVPAYHIAVT